MKRFVQFLALWFAFFLGPLFSATGQTSPISFGAIKNGSLAGPTQTNYYTFTANSNDVIYVALLRTNGSGSPVLFLDEPDGFRRPANVSSEFAELANLPLTQSGTYTIAVFSLDQSYDFLLSLTQAACGVNQREAGDGAEAIVPGQIANGHISPADMDTFCFTASSNDVIYLALLRTNGPGSYPAFYLYDPDGIAVLASVTADFAEMANRRLTKSGTYTVGVLDNGLDESFDYLLSLTKAACGVNQREAGDGAEAIVPGQITNGHISPADMDTFCFPASSNDVIYLAVLRTNGGTFPAFYLYDPDGVALLANVHSDFAELPNHRLTKSGTYTVGVLDNGLDEAFDYLLSLTQAACGTNQREAGDGAEAIVPGQITSGHITPLDMDTFCFPASSNDVIYLAVLRTNGGTFPAFYLYDPDGVALLANVHSDFAELPNHRLTKSGTYTVGVLDNGLDEAFDYLLSLTQAACGTNQREAGDGAEAIVPGQITSGHITPLDVDTFCFTASSNDVIYLAVLRTNGGSFPAFYLYDPDGVALLANVHPDFAELPNHRLTKGGTYTVGVLDNGLDEAFDYNLCMIKNPGPNFPDPDDCQYLLLPGETCSAQITPGDLDAFAFHAIAGDTLTIEVQKTSGTGLNPVVQLHAPDGTVLATASSSTSAEISVSCVPQTGTYLIVILDNGLDEAFGYAVTLGQTPIVPLSSGTNQYLAVYQCANDVVLRWETNSVGFILESTFTLPGTNWFPVNKVPQVIADHLYVHEGMATNMAQFYRLRCPNCVPGSLAP